MEQERSEPVSSGVSAARAGGTPSPGRVVSWFAKKFEVAIAPLQISLAQYRTLGYLAGGSAGASAVAERLAVKPPSVTSVVDGLVARGFVVRHSDVQDRRRQSLVITDAGLQILGDADELAEAFFVEAMSFLDDAGDIDRAFGALETWERASSRWLEAHLQGAPASASLLSTPDEPPLRSS